MFIKKLYWLKSVFVHLILVSSFGAYLFLGMALFQNPALSGYQLNIKSFVDYYINSIDYNFLIYFSFIAIIYTLLYFEKVKNSESNSSILNTHLESSKLNLLQSQINPNFLFNGLSTISSLMKTNVQLAQNTTEDISEYLRDSMKIKGKKLIPIRDEIKLSNKYVDIMRVRFYDQLNIDIKLEDTAKDCLMAGMVLQPIIENSIKHGFTHQTTKLKIDIEVSKQHEQILIVVKNDGKPLENHLNVINYSGFGLNNLKERLQLIYSNNYKFSIGNLDNHQGVITEISIPCASA